MHNISIIPMSELYQDYLMDESKYQGFAESISFPENEADIIRILKEMKQQKKSITIQGGRTGIVGGAVPCGGHIMNLSRMNCCKESFVGKEGNNYIIVESGVTLMELEKEINKRFKGTVMWPVQPTETTATIGGIAATLAEGINACLYGDSRQYFHGVRFLTADGEIINIERGTKDEPLLNKLLGSEGIAGIFSELTLKLVEMPKMIWGISFFFERLEDAGGFAEKFQNKLPEIEGAEISALEFFDQNTIQMIEGRKSTMTKLKELPDVEEQFKAMIYLELQGNETVIEELAEMIMEYAMECNSDPDKAWAVSSRAEVEKMRAFRHGAAEISNLTVEEARKNEPRITKLGTDMLIEGEKLTEVLTKVKTDVNAAGLKYCIFGHIIGNHLHINLFPIDYKEYQAAIGLIRSWASFTKEKGGRIICEHGIGKLKKELLGDLIDSSYLNDAMEMKQHFDKEYIWNPGNISDLWKHNAQ